ncbi:MAG: acyl-CoA reductase [Gemmatimonadota bacterium]|jgi:hypothetical protein
MTSFKAWYLPPSFSLTGDEVADWEGVGEVRAAGPYRSSGPRGIPPFQYPALSEPGLKELVALLRSEREESLASLPLRKIVGAVDRVANRFLDPGDSLRSRAVEMLGAFAGFSIPMAKSVLDGMARGWVQEGLWDLVRSDFPDPGVLDGFRPGMAGDVTRAMGYPVAFHLGAGTVPGVATTSMIRSLLVKSALVLKPGLGDIPLPVLFARTLAEESPELARSVAVLYWPVDESGRTETVLNEADLVVAYGSDKTIRWIRSRIPPHTPLRPYRHRMGFGLIGKDALTAGGADGSGTVLRQSGRRAAAAAARSVALFDQKGCVSPHVFFVERGGAVTPEEWAGLLAGELEELEEALPSGEMSLESGAALQQLRGEAELLASAGQGVVHHGGEEAPWTVLFSPGGDLEPSCLHRTVRVIPVDRIEDGLLTLKKWGPFLQTVGVTGLGSGAEEVVGALTRLGVSRITSLENTPWPRPWWHHDGGGPLRDLARWTDLEVGEGLSSDIVGE